jgi:hypothetical protein
MATVTPTIAKMIGKMTLVEGGYGVWRIASTSD